MRTNHSRTALISTASASALCLALTNAALAVPPTFEINPNSISGVTGLLNPQPGTDFSGNSNALIQQTGASTQTEQGFVYFTAMINNNVSSLPVATSGIDPFGPTGLSNTYGLYLLFSGSVQGLSSFTSPATGTILPGNYSFALIADVGANDTITNASTSASGGSTPSITDNSPNDVVIAVGTSLFGQVVVNGGTLAPSFGVTSDFILCNGSAGLGNLGAQMNVAASVTVSGNTISCGSFDAANYFVAPSPFFSVNLDTATPGSGNNLTIAGTLNPGADANATISTVDDLNFVETPEPGTLFMFGFGLLGLGWFMRRRQQSA